MNEFSLVREIKGECVSQFVELRLPFYPPCHAFFLQTLGSHCKMLSLM